MSPEVLNSVLGLIAAILGVIAALLSLRHLRRRGAVRYGLWTLNLATNLHPGPFGLTDRPVLQEVTFRYRGKRADTLSVTRMVLWNGGARIIDASDIAGANPIRLSASDGIKILDVRVLKMSDKGTNLAVKQSAESSAEVTFDYLEPKSGGIVEIVHTGYRSGDLRVEGSVRGCGEIREPFLHDLSGLSRFGFFLGYRPIAARLAAAGFTAVWLYIFLFCMYEMGMFSYRSYYEAMVERYSPEIVPYLYGLAIIFISYAASTFIGAIWIYLGRRPTKKLREFDRSWGTPSN